MKILGSATMLGVLFSHIQLDEENFQNFIQEAPSLSYSDGSTFMEGRAALAWCSQYTNIFSDALVIRFNSADGLYAVVSGGMYDITNVTGICIFTQCAKCGRKGTRRVTLSGGKDTIWCALCEKWEEVSEYMCLTALDELEEENVKECIDAMQNVMKVLDRVNPRHA